MEIKEKFCKTKWGKICYYQAGDDFDKVLIDFHWAFGWHDISVEGPYFNSLGYQVIAPSLPGHGLSWDLPLGTGHGDLVESLGEFLQNVASGKKVILTGQSFGAGLALEIVKKYPQVVDLLVVDCPVVRPLGPKLWQTLLQFVWEGAVGKVERLVRGETVDVIPVKHHIRYPKLKNAKPLWRVLTKMVINSLHRVKVPTLIIYGRRDKVVNFEKIEPLIRQIPSSKVVGIDGNHGWSLVRPKTRYDLIYNFAERGLNGD